jgi:hypothetical protein
MITFVRWKKGIDAAFRAFYPTVALDGETVEDEPKSNKTHYLLGSARLSATAVDALRGQFGTNIAISESEPEGFE